MPSQSTAGALVAEPAPPTEPGLSGPGTSRRRLWVDRLARWAVSAGGFATIASILGILIFILIEVAPLLGGASVTPLEARTLPGGPVGALLSDEHRSHVAALSTDGRLRVVRMRDGRVVLERSWPPEPADGAQSEIVPETIAAVVVAPGQQLFSASTSGGRVLAARVEWEVSFPEGERVVEPRVGDPVVFDVDPGGRAVQTFSARLDDDGQGVLAALTGDGRIVVQRREVQENFLTGETTEDWSTEDLPLPVDQPPSVLLIDQDGLNLYGGNAAGELLWWRLSRAQEPPQVVSAGSAITAMTLLLGDRSLIVGQADGTVSVWFPVRQSDEGFRITKIREFEQQRRPIRLLAPSFRDKGFVGVDDAGGVALYYSTSHRVMWTGEALVEPVEAVFYTPKADGLFLAGGGRLVPLELDNPHPEISWSALFGRVWYEGYEQPAHVWQSTGGTDEFEPKLSLTPLIVGTLKGTLYSLFLAIPLAVLGAMYAAHFMHPSLRRVVKPTVEVMAALPSVVLGFLAGLWLAPRIEQALPALALMALILPVLVVVAGFGWSAAPLALRQRFPIGSETALYASVLILGGWISLRLAPLFEVVVFGGDLRAWLLETTGLPYDQRNAVVVGLAMGFAVIPIIFSIADDALSNVPRTLVSGSLALGADRWQTVARVVLPTASPGIFSAIMIGFGRAVGETMIVLMATGNTPLMDWNPFNGFRTLSANIAVEIPEAPQGATLYRTLFLAAFILFVFTFVLNTVAELVRQRLRRRYAEL